MQDHFSTRCDAARPLGRRCVHRGWRLLVVDEFIRLAPRAIALRINIAQGVLAGAVCRRRCRSNPKELLDQPLELRGVGDVDVCPHRSLLLCPENRLGRGVRIVTTWLVIGVEEQLQNGKVSAKSKPDLGLQIDQGTFFNSYPRESREELDELPNAFRSTTWES